MKDPDWIVALEDHLGTQVVMIDGTYALRPIPGATPPPLPWRLSLYVPIKELDRAWRYYLTPALCDAWALKVKREQVASQIDLGVNFEIFKEDGRLMARVILAPIRGDPGHCDLLVAAPMRHPQDPTLVTCIHTVMISWLWEYKQRAYLQNEERRQPPRQKLPRSEAAQWLIHQFFDVHRERRQLLTFQEEWLERRAEEGLKELAYPGGRMNQIIDKERQRRKNLGAA